MTTNQIKKASDRLLKKFHAEIDAMARARAVELVRAIRPNFVITDVICGMGSWTLSGESFPIVYGDDSTGTKEIERLLDSIDGRHLFSPVNCTEKDRKHIRELFDLMDWWVDLTGGLDITIKD